MKRRQFLALTAGGVAMAGAGAGLGVWLFCPGPCRAVDAAGHLDELAESMHGVADAGRAWREAHAGARIAASLLESMDLAPDTSISREEMTHRLADRVESDLAEGRIFRHENWWLSETEARLAALHVALLGSNASEAEAPEFENAPESSIVSLERFEPRAVIQGQPLSHPDLADNVIWFGTSDPAPPRLKVHIAGAAMAINVTDKGFSIRVPEDTLARLHESPGEHEIWLYDPVAHQRQLLGELTVREQPESEDGFCEIERWGPKQTRVGQPFNEQPDGASAFWIRIACFPPEAVVVFNNVEIPTTRRPGDGLITTHITDHTLYEAPGEYEVKLVDPETGKEHPVGTFTVEPR